MGLMLLSAGHVAYLGPAKNAQSFFTDLGFPCAPAYGMADHMLDLVVLRNEELMQRLKEREEGRRGTKGIDRGGGEEEEKDAGGGKRKREEGEEEEEEKEEKKAISPLMEPAVGHSEPVQTLLSRSLAIGRKEEFSWENVALFTGLSLIAAVVWVQLGMEESNIFERVTCVLWIVSTWMFFPLFGMLMVFPAEERVIKKELSLSAYSLSAYYCARSLSILSLSLVWPVFYITLVFWITALNWSFSVFLLVVLANILHIVGMQGLGLCLSAGVPPRHVMTAVILLVTLLFATSGFMVPYADMHPAYSWILFVNPLTYAWALCMFIVFSSQAFTCAGGGEVETTFPAYCPPSAFNGTEEGQGGERNTIPGLAVLSHFNIDMFSPQLCLGIMCLYVVVFRVLAFVILRWKWVVVPEKMKVSITSEHDEEKMVVMGQTHAGKRKEGQGSDQIASKLGSTRGVGVPVAVDGGGSERSEDDHDDDDDDDIRVEIQMNG